MEKSSDRRSIGARRIQPEAESGSRTTCHKGDWFLRLAFILMTVLAAVISYRSGTWHNLMFVAMAYGLHWAYKKEEGDQ
jgi:hypothetical protein